MLLPKKEHSRNSKTFHGSLEVDKDTKLMLTLILEAADHRMHLKITNQQEEQAIVGMKIDVLLKSTLVGRQKVTFGQRMDLQPL